MFNLLSKFKYQLLLLFIVAIIGLVNYRFGTYLTGWDNLQTELAPALAVKRAFLAVWQEYQSFGLVGGMAHASDLLRACVVWLMSFVLPQSMIRYVFHIGMYAIGGLGAYTLLQFARWRDGGPSRMPEQNAEASGRWDEERQNLANWTIFVGSLFYLLNFATIQLFFLPFEPFSIFFASLPWLVWVFLRTIHPKPAHTPFATYFPLLLVNLLATPSFYVQTIFIVYMLVLSVISIATIFKTIKSNSHLFFKRLVPLILSLSLIILLNLFWILPQVYFLINGGSQVVANAKINSIATENVYYQNKARGDIASFATLKGFYYDLQGSNNTQIFADWQKHLNNPVTVVASWSIFAIILLGLTRKSTYRVPFTGIWALCAFALLSDTPVISSIHELIRHNALIAQIFRAPFTKFAVPLALTSSYFFVQGIHVILSIAKNLGVRLHTPRSISLRNRRDQDDSNESRPGEDDEGYNQRSTLLVTLVGLVLIAVLCFPVFTGHLFSDLVRTTIPQPYFQTIDYFKTINKEQRIALMPQDSFWGWYNYSWGYTGSGFLWYGIEQPIVSPTFDVWSNKSESYLWEMKSALASQQASRVHDVLKKYNIHYLLLDDSILPVSARESGFAASRIKELLANDNSVTLEKKFGTISIYHVTNAVPFVTSATTLPKVGPIVDKTDHDTAYSTLGNYQSGTDYYFPFLGNRYYIEENDTTFSIKTQLPFDSNSYTLQSTSPTLSPSLTASMQGNIFAVTVNKELIEQPDVTTARPTQCNKLTICLAYQFPNISQEDGYVLKVTTEHVSGQRFFLYVQNSTTKEAVIEDRLTADTQHYLVPPGNHFGRGYTIGLQNDSYAGTISENSLVSLQLYKLPYNELKSLYFARVKPDVGKAESIIIYNQSFDPGWKAYSNGKELTNHVVINNWANGWIVPADSNKQVSFFFLPQILEFVGLAVACLVGLITVIHFIIKRI